MSKLLLLCTVLIGLTSAAQTTVTTIGFNSCYWNDSTQRFDIECQYRYLISPQNFPLMKVNITN